MATAEKNYSDLKAFLNRFPKWVETKKDLLKIKDKKLLYDYNVYKIYFKITDKRYKPKTVINELKKFKKTNIFFKSEELGIDLLNHPDFDEHDYYKSSDKLIAKVTDAMLDTGCKLNSISSSIENIDIRYKVTKSRKVIHFDNNDNFEFMKKMSDSYYINITKSQENGKTYRSSYNKNGLDFIYDYHNQSNDFSEHLSPLIEDKTLLIYKF